MNNKPGQIVPFMQYNMYPNIITFDEFNPYLTAPDTDIDLYFYQTKETLLDVDTYRNFLRNSISRFRRSKYYKTYKSYLMSLGFNRCQAMGNITEDDVGERGIELHHNIINLFDIALMITEHTINTIGMISTFDLIQLIILEHFDNNVPITFLSETAHQLYTNDQFAYIPPEMTFGKWWVLLSKYRYGITMDIAYKIINYIKKYKNNLPITIDVTQQEQIINFAAYNEYGMPKDQCGFVPYSAGEEENYWEVA